jgi:hypothetical protein
VLLIYFKHFGGYLNVITCAILLEIWEQALISTAVTFTILTGSHTVYTVRQFSGRMSPVQNLLSHLTFGLGIGTLFGAGMGCLLLLMLRLLVPLDSIEKHG